jgi:membrane fusion protein (multidrug efflux system)
MRRSAVGAVTPLLISVLFVGCETRAEHQPEEAQQITATSPVSESVVITQRFVCQIHSQKHIELRALERGYLEEIQVKEGQAVKDGDEIFTIMPVIYKARLDAEKSTAKQAQLEFTYAQKLAKEKVVSDNEVAILETKLRKAEANVKLAEAELNFATIKAPFDGIINKLKCQQGSLVEYGEVLTSLSDNSVMWVYFNVPEAQYFQCLEEFTHPPPDLKLVLILADGVEFDQVGKIGAIEADFDNTAGIIPFRADFPNPYRLLRNGQTGTVKITRAEPKAIVIPQRSTFEIANKIYVYVIDDDHVAHRREISIKSELEDLFILSSGVSVDEKILYEGIRQVHDGDKVEYTYRKPEDVFEKLKFHAE